MRSAEDLRGCTDLCIYVCGSFGRLEASTTSDLDLFFVDIGKEPTGNVEKTLIDATVIRIAREMKFPEFSNDGEYLQTHRLGSIVEELGGRVDDYRNLFTARLLLILESRPVFGDAAYAEAVDQVIETYYRDYHDHEKDFQPAFLLNDIVRYWKSMCLNYEHKRNRKADTEQDKAKHHLRNFKLKFSRLITCYSMVIPLAARRRSGPEELRRLVSMTPLERLHDVAQSEQARATLSSIVSEYVWFLEQVRNPNEILNELRIREKRDELFERGRRFAGSVYRLLLEVTGASDSVAVLRYVVM